ncbi:MAG: phosphoenolpyruvate--protein phosphotransferase [Actinobacteria bacterium]|nr:MAG: phosphoenolpyruvate--protein phosphotransferase [Actinomycetota bacterium]
MPGARLEGVAASEGVAVGPAFVHAPDELEPQRTGIAEGEVEAELERFRGAIEAVVAQISEARDALSESGSEEAEILDAHVELAGDPELHSEVEERVRNLESPEAAVLAVGEEFAGLFAGMEDEYMAARADDVRDVTSQIAAQLMGLRSSGLAGLAVPSVVLARNLAPSETARMPREMVLGLVTAEGSKTSHVSIMARSMGIPAVVGVGAEALERALGAGIVAVHGDDGYVVTDPDADEVAFFEGEQAEAATERAALEAYRHVEARTHGGRRIEVAANLGSPKEAADALSWGAEGVGLFRTEFLFMERDELPTEEEQYGVYREVAEAFGEKPVIIRTIDVGGDKDLPGVSGHEEENPFLGWRGIRMSLDVPDLFRPQLRAILRAAAHGNLKVMFPMVSSVEEFVEARCLLAECREELEREGAETGPVEAGVMVETPAAALCADELAREVDFFSIGTNDLTQYALAVDRGNEKLEKLYRADHPAVLKLIEMTCRAAEKAGIQTGVCGEAAGDPALAPKLVALGVTELSMSPPAIPRAKKIISELP